MKVCAACHEDLPKESYSKKQWKLDKYQRRCKVCVTNNRKVQLQQPPQQNDNDTNDNDIIRSLDSMYLEDVEKISDEQLFKQPPQAEDCLICFLRMPILNPTGSKYQSCCGKVICSGCIHAPVYDDQGNEGDDDKQNECAFCRVVAPNSEKELIKRMKKRVVMNDPIAIYGLGCYYRDGRYGLSQDYNKALELFYRAGELGYSKAYLNIGHAHMTKVEA